MITKCLVVPYFGNYPPWMTHWFHNTERLQDHGYEFLFDNDERDFRARVKRVLGIECPPMAGTGRVWNYRPAFGELYADELKDFDWWGHTDFDLVYGRVERWYTDEYLSGLDITANHHDYISGPWTLYRNNVAVNSLYRASDEWIERMEGEDYSHGWAEKGFTELVDFAHEEGLITRRYDCWQSRDWNDFSTCRLGPGGELMEGDEEIAMLHFRRTKTYPEGCIL